MMMAPLNIFRRGPAEGVRVRFGWSWRQVAENFRSVRSL